MPYIGRADFNYRIIRWSADGQHIAHEPAGIDDFDMAVAAYEVAVRKWGAEALVTLQQGARIVRKSRED